MTIIKQGGVSSKAHEQNLRKYINDDKKVLLRDSQNMEECRDLKRWASYMRATREEFGHNTAGRRVRDKETGELVEAKNTTMYHQILAFLPESCDINGGKMTPERCMEYAKEYARRYYPNQEIVFALHNEYCREDRTHRYAVHMVINRTDTVSGKRLDEGLSRSAKVKRANRVREMDAEWDLPQVEQGVANSKVHKRQPSRAEKEIKQRGGKSYKTNLRELCREAASRAKNIYEYRELLDSWGVDTQFRNGRMYATDRDNARYSFSVTKLDSDLDSTGLKAAFVANVGKAIDEAGERDRARREAQDREEARLANLKLTYLSDIEHAYLDYRREAHAKEGTPLDEFPKLKLPRPPQEVANDAEVRRTILAYWRGADELRVEMASGVPYARGNRGAQGGSSEGRGRSDGLQEQTRGRDAQNR